MAPVSLPVSPAKPVETTYGIERLEVYKRYTRESFKAAFGVDAPNWDPTRRAKAWFNSQLVGAGDSFYGYLGYDEATQSLRSVTIPSREAATVNLPGVTPWEPYEVAPTNAIEKLGHQPINAMRLSTHAQALTMMNALKLNNQTVVDEGLGVIDYGDDDRREWAILPDGGNVGLLLELQGQSGVGHPGKFGRSADGTWFWTPAEVQDGINTGVATEQAVPVPLRPLTPDERFIIGFGGRPEITRDAPSSSAGADPRIDQIATDVAWIRKVLAKGGFAE